MFLHCRFAAFDLFQFSAAQLLVSLRKLFDLSASPRGLRFVALCHHVHLLDETAADRFVYSSRPRSIPIWTQFCSSPAVSHFYPTSPLPCFSNQSFQAGLAGAPPLPLIIGSIIKSLTGTGSLDSSRLETFRRNGDATFHFLQVSAAQLLFRLRQWIGLCASPGAPGFVVCHDIPP